MITFSILASAGIMAALISYRVGQNEGYRAGSYDIEECLADRNGWYAAYRALLELIPDDYKEDAENRAVAAFEAVRDVNAGGGELAR
jgi:hypothetical protein